jgi:hypothetical protein
VMLDDPSNTFFPSVAKARASAVPAIAYGRSTPPLTLPPDVRAPTSVLATTVIGRWFYAEQLAHLMNYLGPQANSVAALILEYAWMELLENRVLSLMRSPRIVYEGLRWNPRLFQHFGALFSDAVAMRHYESGEPFPPTALARRFLERVRGLSGCFAVCHDSHRLFWGSAKPTSLSPIRQTSPFSAVRTFTAPTPGNRSVLFYSSWSASPLSPL